ncbi:hypothetical protein BOTBODRAFT_31261 [Botryobasidium botryosum FD-172 SS1]|uniref:F-box domain-containing protein n=1 Tax=Botryobasidium botryosum (strain FD-172 SS1) TaxID=930990 RepID=A0A067MV91_BOTB1|nr:hypothetical protein BOTBODRAFT_31261 [Botryobasidium botryosum FD-172 SS1]
MCELKPGIQTILADIIPPLLQTLVDRVRQYCDIDAEKGSFMEEIEALKIASNALNAYTTSALCSLLYRHNQLALVHRLPDEVLSLIFLLSAEPAVTDKQPPSKLHPIRISGVCQRWRAAALETPRLWARVHAVGPRPLMDLFSSRSGNAPLHISASPRLRDEDGEDYQAFHWSQHINRWASLKLIEREGIVHYNSVWEWVGQAAPSLEALDVCMYGCSVLGIVPGKLFNGKVPPHLRHISLEGIHLPLTDEIFANLTKLRLARMLDPPTDVIDLLQALGASPRLEELSVEDIHYDFDFINSRELVLDVPLDIHLNHLQHLSLLLEAWVIQFILARVTIPPRAKLEIGIKNLSHDQDLSHIFPPHPSNLRNLQSIHTLIFSPSDDRRGCMVGGISVTSGGGCTSLLSIVISGAHSCAPVQRIMASLGPTLSLMPIKHISLEQYSNRKWSATTLINTFNHFPSLEILLLSQCHAKFLRALTVTSSHHPCPGLRTLGISDCAISDDALIAMVLSRTKENKEIRPPGAYADLCLLSPLHGSTAVRDALFPLLKVEGLDGPA